MVEKSLECPIQSSFASLYNVSFKRGYSSQVVSPLESGYSPNNLNILNPEELQESSPSKSPFLDGGNPKFWVTCRHAKVLSAWIGDGHHLAPSRDGCGLALNTDPSHTSAQAPIGPRNTGLTSYLNMTSSCQGGSCYGAGLGRAILGWLECQGSGNSGDWEPIPEK